jgi:hypothetical protein
MALRPASSLGIAAAKTTNAKNGKAQTMSLLPYRMEAFPSGQDETLNSELNDAGA